MWTRLFNIDTWAAVSGSALNGAFIMVAFGLGTMPAMLFIGIGVSHTNKLQKSNFLRQSGAVIILLYGLYTVQQTITLLSVS